MLQNPHLPIWQSSRFPSLPYLPTLSSPLTTKTQKSSSLPSFDHPHTHRISSTSSTLVGSTITPPEATHSNTPTFAKKCTASTTLRLAWSHPLLYPVHPAQRRPMTCTSLQRSVLTPPLDQQSSIYVPSINHNDLAHFETVFLSLLDY